ncbi:MAG: flagellar hook-basal body complex protein FliE [Magnetococcus sp. DMHC-6]
MSIGPIQASSPLSMLSNITSSQAKGGAWEEFSVTLGEQIKETDRLQKNAKDLSNKALLGNAGVSIHEAQIASAQADLHLRLLMQVRNKAIEVYREIMTMQA